jgi:hypothetical protein
MRDLRMALLRESRVALLDTFVFPVRAAPRAC